MVPAPVSMDGLVKRYYRCDYYGNCDGAWDSWVRWLVLGLIILGVIVIFFLFSCISARRRRRMGYTPYRGTGWAAGSTPPGHAPAAYYQQPQRENNYQPSYANNNDQTAPPPAYGQSQSYYGGARNDVELQQPQTAYNGVYAPPSGPPPNKQEVIR